MQLNNVEIKPYKDEYKQQLLTVWEQSVLATHHFLSETDFIEIKALVQAFDFHALQVYCVTKADEVLGFVGVADRKIEMLFISPFYIGQGLGEMLTDFAIQTLAANKLDVNEQNTKALKFYKKMGFKTYERTDKDDQGRNYPLLRMHLK